MSEQVDVMFHGIEARPAIGNVLDGSAGNMKLLLRCGSMQCGCASEVRQASDMQ